ncbi:MAG: polysaccharide deacetylase family protein [Cocleimonas sp.]
MKNLTIIMYHYVREINGSRYPEIKGLELELFTKQLDFIEKNYSVVTMDMVIEASHGELELPNNSCLLTFDDGYTEHFTVVYPLLKKYNMQGSFFIPAKTVLEHKVLDVNKIHFILSSIENKNEIINFLKQEIVINKEKYALKDFQSYYSEFAHENRFDSKDVIFIKRVLQHALPEKLRNELTDKLFSKFVGVNEEAFAKELYMNKFQIEHMIQDGMHIGCHGYDHYWWNRLDSEQLEKEILDSKSFLKSLGCNMSNWTACYPYGGYDDTVINTLKKHGCKLAFTTKVDTCDVKINSPYLLPRLDTNDLPPKSERYKNL